MWPSGTPRSTDGPMDHAQEDEYECTLIHEVSQDTEYPLVFPVDVILQHIKEFLASVLVEYK